MSSSHLNSTAFYVILCDFKPLVVRG
uniref:Uncharacterized protein n=1 Tax=Arundo donax TaxID=35708 RepID=A0A0A8YR92_ARUDO